MAKVEIVIPGKIGGKGRPRATIRKGKSGALHAGTYTPYATRRAEDSMRYIARRAMGSRRLLDGPLSMRVEMFLHHPKSWSKKKKAMIALVTGKPDVDNIVKSIADAFNEIVYHDDSQIAQLTFGRWYGGPDQPVQTFVEISELAPFGVEL